MHSLTAADESFIRRALDVADAAAGRARPNPTVGAVVVLDGDVVGEGATEEQGARHAEVVALDQAGERARGATLYVTMEPCTHHGHTPPCVERALAAGVSRVVTTARDPNPKATGGLEQLRGAGVEVAEVNGELAERARRQNEAWRVWVAERRAFVTLKLAVSVDGRVVVPGRRWVSGEASRRRVHALRTRSDAVAVGMGTVRTDAPRLDARGVGVSRQPRRLVFGRGPLPEASELELVRGPLHSALEQLADEGVQSLLIEGGPTLAASFLAEDFVDKLLVFVAPVVAGAGPRAFGELRRPRPLHRLTSERVGDDVLLESYVRPP